MKVLLLGTRNVTSLQSRSEKICKEAESVLRANPHLLNQELTCDYHEGTLILRGRVGRYYHKQVAQTVAALVEGVEQVVNQIKVDDQPAK